MSQAVCNRSDVIIATTSSDTGHERVVVTVRARGASFDAGSGVKSAGCRISVGGVSPPASGRTDALGVGPAVSRRRGRSISTTRRS
jgi:hypothetical protein